MPSGEAAVTAGHVVALVGWIGVGLGIGKLAASALEGMARQPQAAGTIQTAMLIAAGFIEGAGLFALVICIIMAFK